MGKQVDTGRLPRTRRAKRPPAIQITNRDIELIRAVLRYRFLTIRHCLWLFPDGSAQKLQVRLKLLYHHGYLERLPCPGLKTDKLVYALTEKGALLLAEAEGTGRDSIKWGRHLNKVTQSHLAHWLAVTDVLICHRRALAEAKSAGQITEFKVYRGKPTRDRLSVEVRSHDGRILKRSVIPDAVIAVASAAGESGVFFVEVDRATMSNKKWQEKIVAYQDYRRYGDFVQRFQARWFIVLTLTTTARRLRNLAESTLVAGGQRGFWFTESRPLTPSSALLLSWQRAAHIEEERISASFKTDVTTLLAAF